MTANDRRITDLPDSKAARPGDGQAQNVELADLRAANADLKRQLEQAAEKNSALALYGEPRENAVIRDRLMLAPWAKDLTDKEVTYVAQVAALLRWNPYFDLYAFKTGGKMIIMADYKKLIDLVREEYKGKIDMRTRPATVKEREDYGIKEDDKAFITEVIERDVFFEYVKNECAHLYPPTIGVGIWHKGESVPATWTPEMRARTRSLRDAMYQMGAYQIAMRKVQEALVNAGAKNITVSDGDFVVEIAEETKAQAIEGEIVPPGNISTEAPQLWREYTQDWTADDWFTKFWSKIKPVTAKELHAALNVESMKDVQGTVDDVMAVVAKLTEQHALDLA